MKLVEHFERIKKMNGMIRCGQTGTPSEFANCIGISQSHLFRCLKELEQLGMDVQYSRSLKTYYYGNSNELAINYSLRLIIDSYSKEIIGGSILPNLPYQESLRGRLVENCWAV